MRVDVAWKGSMLHDIAQPRRRRPVILLAGLGAVILLAAIVLAAVHTSPVRAYALRYAARAVLNLGIRLEARRLDYNLLTLRVGLVGVTVSAVGEERPFFVADEVRAHVSSRVFRGELAVEEVTVSQGAVQIVRRADGSTNLPRSTRTSQGEPAPLPLARLLAPRLSIEYQDEGNAIDVRAPALTLDLAAQGRLSLDAPMAVTVGTTSTVVTGIESGVAFDGRDMRLSNFRIEAPEVRAGAEGTLGIVRRQPAVDLRVSGDVDLARAAKWWGQSVDAPIGVVRFDGPVRGPFAGPSADLRLSSEDVVWNAVATRRLSADLDLDASGIEISESRFDVAGGQVAAAGGITWDSGQGRVKASWRGVDAARAVAMLVQAGVLPSGRTSGELTASGPVRSFNDWDVDARLGLDRGPEARGRIAAPGETRLHLADGRWQLEAQHVVGGVTPVTASLTGLLRGPDLAASTVSGVVSS